MRGSEDDFGKGTIPMAISKDRKIFAYDYEKENKIEDFVVEVREGARFKILVDRTHDSSYWKDIGTIDSYYEVNMELLDVDPPFNLYGEKWPFRAYERSLPPSKFVFGGRSPDSMVSDGCIISGGVVWKSILSPGVVVERDALVEESIVLDDVSIAPGARIRRAIIDADVRIKPGASIGYDLEADARKGCIISDKGIVVVPGGMVVGLD